MPGNFPTGHGSSVENFSLLFQILAESPHCTSSPFFHQSHLDLRKDPICTNMRPLSHVFFSVISGPSPKKLFVFGGQCCMWGESMNQVEGRIRKHVGKGCSISICPSDVIHSVIWG